MATLALSLAGQFVGGAIAGPIGATIGRALGGLAGSAVDSVLFGPRAEPRPGSDIRLGGSSEGMAVPRVYGWSRVAGNIVWATDLERITPTGAGAKGFGVERREGEEVAASFALALCEGEVAHVGRIWADGKPLETFGLEIRFHSGSEDQLPDSFIEAKQGEGRAPAYRGIAYLVFERLPLGPFGNRVPNLTVEICRPVGELEPAIRALCVIPGSTEFGYDPVPRVKIVGPGVTEPENLHMSARRSNWELSIDELTALCPNLKHIGLVVSWFGTDLRCGTCAVEPRVENHGKVVEGTVWSVAGRMRDEVNVVSTHEGGPAYGGTPSDEAVIAAIADLTARGIAVTLYPFMMMDIPWDNDLVDPYTLATGQPSYPWRGRITCHPAPGVAGSPDGTGAAAAQVAAFLANGYRELVLHYAHLAVAAGGVDAFLIGSEMREMTFIRSGPQGFPFVDGLRTLAAEARAILGPDTKITYAADWSEYSGLQPSEAPGDKIFHLDPLWADPAIDVVGIDNYMPLADWRDRRDHADAEAFASIYETGYIKANIAGGEGFEWYYASAEDRAEGLRSPITDGAHGEPWIYRYKDLVNWWREPHHNRIGGVRASAPTPWVPAGKPIWLTELGCGAVDKGANAPNIFGDPKSAEDGRPYFSSGDPDRLMQRQVLRANHEYWTQGEGENPVSPVYGGPMLDPERVYLWCWDARPYPAFPNLLEVWTDGTNYPTGHWLNGRLGALSPDELLRVMAVEFSVPAGRIDTAPPLVTGLALDSVLSLREATAALLEATGLVVRDGIDGISWIAPDDRHTLFLSRAHLMRGEGPLLARRRGDPSEAVGHLTLSYFDRERDYHLTAATAIAGTGERRAVAQSGLVLGAAEGRLAAEGALSRQAQGTDTLETALPPSLLAVEPGDVLAFSGETDGPFVVTETRDGAGRTLAARAFGELAANVSMVDWPRPVAPLPPVPALPVVLAAHLPAPESGTVLRVGAFADPWPGEVQIRDMATGTTAATLAGAATLGVLTEPAPAASAAVWTRGRTLTVTLHGGHIASGATEAVLAGSNRIALRHDDGSWEIVGFARAELVAPATYRLDTLLRGLEGTAPGPASAGNPVLVLDREARPVAVPLTGPGTVREAIVFAGARDGTGTPLSVMLDAAPALPLAPVHLKALRDPISGDIALSWIRRSRRDGDPWSYGEVPLDVVPEAYRVEIFNGETVVRVIETGVPSASYPAAQQAADFGAPVETVLFGVRQVSPVLGPGALATGVL